MPTMPTHTMPSHPAPVHTVLVVDDEEPIRRLLRDTLELDGYVVHEAPDAMQALARIAEQRFDCLVLDVMMPGMSGIDLLAALREDPATANLPVLMLTAANDDTTTWEGWANGASCYLPKPFDLEHLLDWVARLCEPAQGPVDDGVVDVGPAPGDTWTDVALLTGSLPGGSGAPTPAEVAPAADAAPAAAPDTEPARLPAAPAPAPTGGADAALVAELSALYDTATPAPLDDWAATGSVRRHELAAALANHEVWVAYQPIVALATEQVVGVEALARWEHPHRGDVSPAQFVPLAERTGLAGELTSYVLAQAATQVAEWNMRRAAARQQPITLAVNVSATLIGSGRLVPQLRAALERAGLPPAALVLELGEPALMRLLGAEQREVRELVELGVRISFDDFAAATTSLNFLQRFPVDVVKVDRSHVRALDRVDRARGDDSTVAAIVSIAHRLGRRVIAEGVETTTQAEQLRRLGCEYAQGYLFGYPTAAGQLGSRLLARSGDVDLPMT